MPLSENRQLPIFKCAGYIAQAAAPRLARPKHSGSAPIWERSRCSYPSSSSFSTAMNASVGICTVPRERIFFLPYFCFSSSFFFRVMSPP